MVELGDNMTKKKKIISSLCIVATTVILGTSIFFGSAALLKINFSDLFYNANKECELRTKKIIFIDLIKH